MVGEMVQNSQSLYSFTFTAVIAIREYIYSHSTIKFTFKKYICLHLTTHFLFTNIFSHIYGMYHSHSTAYICSHLQSKYSFTTVRYSTFSAHSLCASLGSSSQRAKKRKEWQATLIPFLCENMYKTFCHAESANNNRISFPMILQCQILFNKQKLVTIHVIQ